MATIVYVHGNGNKIPSEQLRRQWDQALFGRDMGAASRMAYWAPVSHARALPAFSADESEQIPETAPETADPPDLFIGRVLREAEAEVPGASAGHLESWLRDLTYTGDALVEGENAAPPVTSPFEALPLPRALRRAAFR